MAGESTGAALQKIIFDTDVLIWYLRGNEKARHFLEHVSLPRRVISSLTLMELLQGCRNQTEARQVRAFVTENIPLVLFPNEFVFRRAIDLLEQYAFAHGLRVVDALIAATALEEGFSLATANVKHYRTITRLSLIPFRL